MRATKTSAKNCYCFFFAVNELFLIRVLFMSHDRSFVDGWLVGIHHFTRRSISIHINRTHSPIGIANPHLKIIPPRVVSDQTRWVEYFFGERGGMIDGLLPGGGSEW